MTGLYGYRDLKVYQLAYKLAMEIFHESKSFSSEERHSLTDQIRRASRSAAANIAEGYRNRQYTKMFVSKMADADGEATETQVWLDFARDCGYLSKERQLQLPEGYEEVGRMLGSMIANPERFEPLISCFLAPGSCFLAPASWLLPPAYCFLASCFLANAVACAQQR